MNSHSDRQASSYKLPVIGNRFRFEESREAMARGGAEVEQSDKTIQQRGWGMNT